MGSTSEERRERCNVLHMSCELELREALEENASLEAAVHEFKMRVKKLKKGINQN